jgi:acetolactate synthase small subunit
VEAMVKDMNVVEDRAAMETIFSYLNKGIDAMKIERLHTLGDTFQIIRDRVKKESYMIKVNSCNQAFKFSQDLLDFFRMFEGKVFSKTK